MKNYILQKQINDELLKEFITWADANSTDPWTIIIESHGGSTAIARILLYILQKKGKDCTLIANKIQSAAFSLFAMATKVNRKLVHGCTGMTHVTYQSVDMDSRGKIVWTVDKVAMKNLKTAHWEADISEAKKVLSKKQLKKFKKGRDLFFHFEELKKMFPDAEVI